jgi:hypothetical protein
LVKSIQNEIKRQILKFMKERLEKLNPKPLSSRLFATLVCLCACLFMFPAHAQDAEGADGSGEESAESKLMIGVRTGVNYSKLIISEGSADAGLGDNDQRRAGLVFGAFVDYSFNKWFGATGEVLFSQQGVRSVGYNDGVSVGVADYRTDNINVNLLLDAKLPVISVYKPKFYVGPSFSFNVGGRADVEGSAFGYPVHTVYNANDQFAAMEFGMIVGTGLDFNLKFATLKTDIRYRRGFNDINAIGIGLNESLRGRTIHSDAISFQVALGFHL